MPETYVGGRYYSPKSGSLSYQEQALIAELSGISGVDYYLILATILHESSCDPTVINEVWFMGYMQINPNYWGNYNLGGNYYNASDVIRSMQEKASGYGASYDKMLDPMGSIAVGASVYSQWMSEFSTPWEYVNAYGGDYNGYPRIIT